ncbi:MAG TPA: glycosyltransferase family 9 protein [Planctomycetota bacterium]|nr:glycosyltransferase family 9 protein [Planctomycetota bacterium]
MHALQRVDKRLGPIACALLQPLRWTRPLLRRRQSRVEKVLLIKFWGVGSLQLLTPSVVHLRAKYPHAELVLLTLAVNHSAAEGFGSFDRVLSFDVGRSGWLGLAARVASLVASLRRERFDAVFDFEFFTRFSALVSLLTGARESHGFASTSVWRGNFHTHIAPFNRYWHVARNFRSLAGGEDGAQISARDLLPHQIGAMDAARVDGMLEAYGIDARDGFAVLNPNAGELNFERRWPQPSFAALAQRLAREDRLPVILIGSRGEREYTQAVVDKALDQHLPRPVNLAGDLSTGELASLLSRCAVFVTNDSGPMHLAAALGTPTVGLFGPETPLLYGPVGSRVRALYRPPACSPCINVHDNKVASCIWGFPQCLVALEVSEVHAAAQAFLRGDDLTMFTLEPVARPAQRNVHPSRTSARANEAGG